MKQLKHLGNPAAHAAPHPYQREEAQLIVRLTASLLALISRAVKSARVTQGSEHVAAREKR
jgi:hypothetical protein